MKRTLMIIGLGIAFVGASLWVMLSGGRSAKAIRAKFRLGGAILTLVSFTSLASCENGGFMVSCYDPAPPPHNEVHINANVGAEFRNGDEINIYYAFDIADTLSLIVLSEDGIELQSEMLTLEPGDEYIPFKLNVGDYRGKATLKICYNVYEALPVEEAFDFVIVE